MTMMTNGSALLRITRLLALSPYLFLLHCITGLNVRSIRDYIVLELDKQDDMATDTPLRSSCHCGAVTVTVPRLPEYINVCQCTICRRYGAAWGYYHPDEVKIETKQLGSKPNGIRQYVWGDRDLTFNFCDNCGCVYVSTQQSASLIKTDVAYPSCYWWPIRPSPSTGIYEMGLNTNIVNNPELLRFVDRKFEYSMLMSAVRSKDTAHPDDPAKY